MALGWALYSVSYLAWRGLGGTSRLTLFLVQGCFLALGMFGYLRKSEAVPKSPCSQTQDSSGSRLFSIFFLASLGMGLLSSGIFCLRWPHGGWDGWAIWTMRARFLFRSGAYWHETFTNLNAWSHPDYPLLLPGTIAALWTALGRESIRVPNGVAFLAMGLVLMALASSVGERRGRFQGALAGLALSGCAFFWQSGRGMTADVPLSLFILLAVVCAHLTALTSTSLRWPLLTGFFAGCAGWTKNEGCVFFVLFSLLFMGWALQTKALRALKYFLLSAVPWGILFGIFKLMLAPRTEMVPAGKESMVAVYLQDPHRLFFILKSWLLYIERFGDHIPLLLVLYAFLVGGFSKPTQRWKLDLWVIGAMGTTYTVAYWITPYDIAWHMSVTADRFILQIWPTVLFAFFTRVNSPTLFTSSVDSGSTSSANA